MWSLATALLPIAVLVGLVAAYVELRARESRRETDELIYALRYAAALNEAGLPGGDYPELERCVRLGVREWHGCARSALGASGAMSVACDGRCDKAWGINGRPRVQLSPTDEDDYAWLADSELGAALADPGTYEGGHAKPSGVVGSEGMNKWCVRECERCVTSAPGESDRPLALRDFTRRVYNIPRDGAA